MLKPTPTVLLGFIAGFLAYTGTRSLVSLVALLFVHPLPVAPLADAMIGVIALGLGIALLFCPGRRTLLFTKAYLGLNLLGLALMLVLSIAFQLRSTLPTWSSGLTSGFTLLCLYFSFQIPDTVASSEV
jgi:hypothetical protein